MKTIFSIIKLFFALALLLIRFVECGAIMTSAVVFIGNTFLGANIQTADQVYLFTLIIALIEILGTIIDFYIVENH